MKINYFRNFLSKKKIYYIIFFIFVVQFYDGFLNTYILLRSNYEERMLKYAGYCDKQGYGFIKFINQKYKNLIDSNIPVISFLDSPTAAGYFYDTNKKNSDNHLIIISASEEDLKKINFQNYYVINQQFNCYFLKKK
jgi:hypothetical protein